MASPVIFCPFMGTDAAGGCCVATTSSVFVLTVGAVAVPAMTMDVSAAATVPTVAAVEVAVMRPLVLTVTTGTAVAEPTGDEPA